MGNHIILIQMAAGMMIITTIEANHASNVLTRFHSCDTFMDNINTVIRSSKLSGTCREPAEGASRLGKPAELALE